MKRKLEENEAAGLEEWQTRVVDELTELSAKLDKLNAFIQTEHFAELEEEIRALMVEQASAMNAYAEVLKARVARF